MSADESHEFDWLEDDGDVVVRAQSAIAVYCGPAGVVIRRQADEYDEMYGHGDGLISFSVEHAPAIAAAILAAAGLDATALAPGPTRAGSNSKDGTAAERQRRRRARQKKDRALDIFDGNDRDGDRDNGRDVTPDGTRNGQAA